MPVTLEINSGAIKLLTASNGEVVRWQSLPLGPGLIKNGLIVEPKAVGARINALFESLHVPKKQVIVGLTCLSLVYRIISLPRMKPEVLEEAVQLAVKQEIPLPLEELYLSWQAIDSGGDELNVFVFGVPRNFIDAAIQALAAAGIKPYIIDLKPLALARVANRENALIVSIEPDSFDIVIVADGIPTIIRTLTPKGTGARIDDNIRSLTDELFRTVEFHNAGHPQSPIEPGTPLLLAGELSAESSINQLIQAEVEYPIESLAPPLKYPDGFPLSAYMVNLGLALKGRGQKRVLKKETARFQGTDINIIPAGYLTKPSRLPARYVFLAAILIIAIGSFFPLFELRSHNQAETTRLRTELSSISETLRNTRLAVSDTTQAEARINEIKAEAEGLKQEHQDILSRGGYFADNFELVVKTLPPEADFTSVKIDSDQIIVTGEADNPFTVVRYATTLESQGVFSEIRITRIDDVEVTIAGPPGVSFEIAISMVAR